MINGLTHVLLKTADKLGVRQLVHFLYEKKNQLHRFLKIKPILKRIQKFNSSEKLGVFSEERSPAIVVSLTSFPERTNAPDILPVALYSLLNQTLKPDKVVLWLSEEEFPRKEDDVSDAILKFIPNGLKICWAENLRAYKKIIPALRKYPNDIIVTADDDALYRSDWLELLYKTWQTHPDSIIAHRTRRINGTSTSIGSYNSWAVTTNLKPSILNFQIGVGGVFYPPNSLYRDVLNQAIFTRISPLNDDIWLWAMAVLNGRKIHCIENGYSQLYDLVPDKIGYRHLYSENISENDIALNRLFDFYKQLKEKVLSALLATQQVDISD